jgi:hypothetical protein
VRGAKGGEKVEFFVGGVGRDAASGTPTATFPDSTPRQPQLGTLFTLTPDWQKISIDVSNLDLRYVLGGFAWVASAANNTEGAVFHLDDIQYELSAERRARRLDQPRFIRSFVTEARQPVPAENNPRDSFDLALRNTAFTYDNALAILAFLADSSPDSLRRARLVGDAMLYAAQNDKTFDDGRLRSAYSAGDLSLPAGWLVNNRSGSASAPGYYVETTQTFKTVAQESVDTGVNAWAMIALLALHKRTNEIAYLDAARGIGEFIRTFKNATGVYRGFTGGLNLAEPESVPAERRLYASSEHNLDVFAAFSVMAQIAGELAWQADAEYARTFVEAMWDSSRGCYLAGTTNPNIRNTGTLPSDVQAWSILALGTSTAVRANPLECAERNHRTIVGALSGFDFNEDKDGIWFESTGHFATAYGAAGFVIQREALRTELRRAQTTAPYGDTFGAAEASKDGVSTGFGFDLFRRLHLASTSWNVFAQLGFNPYYQTIIYD